MSSLLIFIIRIYQATLSPDHGLIKARYPAGYCKFYPSCSEYTAQSIKKHGSILGVYNGVKRVLRCNPFSRPGVDPVN